MESTSALLKRAVFEVTSPKSGDSLVIPGGYSSTSVYHWNILWANTTTEPVIISLWKGYESELSQEGVIAGKTSHHTQLGNLTNISL
jgi:hypothetical protein